MSDSKERKAIIKPRDATPEENLDLYNNMSTRFPNSAVTDVKDIGQSIKIAYHTERAISLK